jgi:NAD+ synthase
MQIPLVAVFPLEFRQWHLYADTHSRRSEAELESSLRFSRDVLAIEAASVAAEIEDAIRTQVRGILHRRGAIVGMSGGIDSSVVATLCARALGPEKVLGLAMPERDSSSDSRRLATLLAARLGIEIITEDLTSNLDVMGCYVRQQQAIRAVFPEYGEGFRCKITLPIVEEGDRFSLFQLTILTPSGEEKTARLPHISYLQIVAATNFKQRVRKLMEYYHADRMNYAVAGTPNRLEFDQGFFVKQGDGAADFMPIAHLYKTQVYQLAAHLGVPNEIRTRPPTTETYSMPQTQEEFYFGAPYDMLDLCLYGLNNGILPADVAWALDVPIARVERIYLDIDVKRQGTRYLHMRPILVHPVDGV